MQLGTLWSLEAHVGEVSLALHEATSVEEASHAALEQVHRVPNGPGVPLTQQWPPVGGVQALVAVPPVFPAKMLHVHTAEAPEPDW